MISSVENFQVIVKTTSNLRTDVTAPLSHELILIMPVYEILIKKVHVRFLLSD
jgi:hypothetical protein